MEESRWTGDSILPVPWIPDKKCRLVKSYSSTQPHMVTVNSRNRNVYICDERCPRVIPFSGVLRTGPYLPLHDHNFTILWGISTRPASTQSSTFGNSITWNPRPPRLTGAEAITLEKGHLFILDVKTRKCSKACFSLWSPLINLSCVSNRPWVDA